jgi:hypothetical protein
VSDTAVRCFFGLAFTVVGEHSRRELAFWKYNRVCGRVGMSRTDDGRAGRMSEIGQFPPFTLPYPLSYNRPIRFTHSHSRRVRAERKLGRR